MAKTNLEINTVFKGTVAGGIYGQLFLEQDTLEKGLIDAIFNVTGTYAYLRAVQLKDGLIDYQCKFEPAGDVEFNEKEVRLKKVMLPLELCKEDFRNTWEGYEMGYSASNSDAEIPSTPLEALMLEIKKTISEAVERDIWVGDYGQSGHFGGLLTELVHDKNATDSFIGDGSKITTATVEDALDLLIEETPIKVLQSSDFKIVMDAKTKSRFRRSLRKQNFAMSEFEYDGYKLETANGLPESTMLSYTRSNVKFLSGLKEDYNKIEVLDMSKKNGDDTYRIKCVYSGGASYVASEYLKVYMTTETKEALKLKKPAPTMWVNKADEIEGDDESNIVTDGKQTKTAKETK